jgi:hypothetical protein
LALVFITPTTTFAANQPGTEWKDFIRSVDRDDLLSRVVKAIKRLVKPLDEPQAPPPK